MIICCGEALIDMLPRQGPDGGPVYLPVPGGALFNTAVALGRLGEDVQFFSGLSTDLFGERLAAHLRASGVGTELCHRSGRPTTLAFVNFVDGNARYTFYDEKSAGRMLETGDLPALPPETKALQFGAISLIPEPCGSAFEELMRRHHADSVIAFDPNIRAGFVDDEDAYRARLGRMTAMSDIIKVSAEDLDWLAPGREFEAIARDWIAAGVKVAVLTLGGDGARAITETMDVAVAARPANVVDTVGAGDSFNAGFLAGLRRQGLLSKQALAALSQESLAQALRFAADVAACTTEKAGADPPWLEQVISSASD